MARALKVCGQHGCPELTRTSHCAAHAPAAWAGSDRRQRLPRDWDRRRRAVLRRDPVCKVCSDALSVEADHVLAGDDHSLPNLQGICKRCHREKTQREAAASRNPA